MSIMGGSFSEPAVRQVVDCGRFDFGAAAGSGTKYVAGPKGKRGRIHEIIFACEEATVFATTLGMVKVGDGTDDDAYALLNIPTATAALAKVIGANGYGDDPDAIIADIPDTEGAIVVTLVEGTGAGLTGIGNVYIVIDWY